MRQLWATCLRIASGRWDDRLPRRPGARSSLCVGWLVSLLAVGLVPSDLRAETPPLRFRAVYLGTTDGPYPQDQLRSADHYWAQLERGVTFAPLALGLLGETRAKDELSKIAQGGFKSRFSINACTALVLLGEADCVWRLDEASRVEIPEFRTWVERGSIPGNVVSWASEALRFLAANEVELPPEIVEAAISRLDHVSFRVRGDAKVILSELTGVMMWPHSAKANTCRDASLPTRCDVARKQAWHHWWASNRDAYITGAPYVHDGLRLELFWQADELRGRFVNDGPTPLELFQVEGSAGFLLDDFAQGRVTPQLYLRPPEGQHKTWRLTDSGAAPRIQGAEPTGTWALRALAPSESSEFAILRLIPRRDLSDGDQLVLVYEQSDCGGGRWCGEVVSNALSALPWVENP